MAQLFFTLVCTIALMTSQWWQKLSQLSIDAHPALRYILLLTTVMILAQLILGATMRHQHAGLAIPDFPTAYGRIWPVLDAESIARYNQDRVEVNAANPITAFQILLQMAHRLVALVILFLVARSAWLANHRVGRAHPLAKVSLAWLGLIVLQFFLGAATIWTGKSADIATAHVALGALSLMTGAMLAIMAARCSRIGPAPAPAATSTAMEVKEAPARLNA